MFSPPLVTISSFPKISHWKQSLEFAVCLWNLGHCSVLTSRGKPESLLFAKAVRSMGMLGDSIRAKIETTQTFTREWLPG